MESYHGVEGVPRRQASTAARRTLGALKRVRGETLAGALIVGGFIAVGLLAPLLAPHDPTLQLPNGFGPSGARPPGSHGFPLGTDQLGRDELSRLIYGVRVALFVALVPNALAVGVALVIGVIGGYRGGWFGASVMRVIEAFMVLPAFLLALALLAVFQPSLKVVTLALIVVTWSFLARVIHTEVGRLKRATHVEAAEALGVGSLRIMARHVVPHLTTLVVVYFTLNAATMVVVEAGLGYLGFGVQPPTPSWGAMIGEAQQTFFWWWLIVLPGVCLAALVMGIYMLGNGLQREFGLKRGARI